MEKITPKDRGILREYAKRQLEIAESDEMKKKEALWYAHNDFKTREPVVTLERWTFDGEFSLLYELKCETEAARGIERWFLGNMINYEYIHDDTVMPSVFPIRVNAGMQPFGIQIEAERTVSETHAYKLRYPIRDLEANFDMLKPSPIWCEKEKSAEYRDFVNETIGDIIPARLAFCPDVRHAYNVYCLMGLEVMMTSMYDCPELFHEMMRMQTEDCLRLWELVEREGCVFPNNFNLGIGQGTYAFTDELPVSKGEPYALGDVWGYLDSQETSEISPAMYNEFFFPYYKKASERFGRINYGCCESVSEIWDDSVSKFDNLAKVSVSPWCDEEIIGGKLRGRNIIYHRKPHPNYLSGERFDEKEFGDHIEKTLRAAKGCFLEISYRDVYTLRGDFYRAKKAYIIIQDLIGKYW